LQTKAASQRQSGGATLPHRCASTACCEANEGGKENETHEKRNQSMAKIAALRNSEKGAQRKTGIGWPYERRAAWRHHLQRWRRKNICESIARRGGENVVAASVYEEQSEK